jgi:hypothetical protein
MIQMMRCHFKNVCHCTFSILQMIAACASETSVNLYSQTVQRHISDDCNVLSLFLHWLVVMMEGMW